MPKPMIRIHNAETGEILDREMTASELKEHEAQQAIYASMAQEEEDKAAAKSALLDRLGISAEEANLLLG
jgi:predicted aminopeptidase